ncbi:glutathione S-transferase family protein [Pinisolibacter aquiterrae]|uniref:glutathione S-transferase family protein n=1 Tax=Pinisolibacter aquiterrae TaxID=2815579 RepID=UPI001C3DBC70|nr:glutathione S-transferase [Pinisolibacter aquiterrae]MBV5263985.1 glutathione S-transferase [Pinisolibacter aquiterrae]MCC8233920.1 glutathione S-transferase [Pinisolibacter aquiterrae]
MLKIWGRANSSNVKKVMWLCEELGVPYERIDAGGAFGVTGTPEYRAMNPNGLVPVIQDGDLTLWESNTILRYIAVTRGGGRFWHDDPGRRALVEMWMDWQLSLARTFTDVIWGLVRTPPEKRDMVAIDKAVKICTDLLAIADAKLAAQPYLSGDDFGLADIALGPLAYAWMEIQMERPSMPHLEAWYARLQARPAWAKVVAIGLS